MRWLILVMTAALAGSVFAQQGWRLETADASWAERGYHYSATFDNKLWIFGGSAGVNGNPGDAWATADGVNWSWEASLAGLGMANRGVMLEFNGELWMMGGGHTSMVWHSPDGVNWTQEPDAPWLGRTWFAGVVFNGRMWIFGGSGTYLFNDVWSTPDGINWTQEVAAANWSAREAHTAAVFNGRMWIIGGADGQVRNDVWSSTDGVNWVQETANASWGPRGLHHTVVYRNRLWVIGGLYSDPQVPWTNVKYDDVWSSADGVNWVQKVDGAPWGDGERQRFAIAVFNNRIWLTGGADNAVGYRNDVWSYGLHISPDGLPLGYMDESYNVTFEAREGDGPFGWSLVSGGLPPGITLDTSPTSASITLTGTSPTTGTYPFTIRLEDNDGNAIEQEYTLQILHPPPPPDNNSSGGSSGCTARSTGSGQARSAGLSTGGLAWLILTAATLAAILRRRDHRAGVCE